MKIFILTLALGLITTSGFSQRKTNGDDSLDKKVLEVNISGPELLTLEMVRELQLTTPQQEEVKQLNEQRYQQLLDTEKSATAKSDVSIQQVHLQNDKALTKVLSSEQFRRFLELEGRQHVQHLSELEKH